MNLCAYQCLCVPVCKVEMYVCAYVFEGQSTTTDVFLWVMSYFNEYLAPRSSTILTQILIT